MCGLNSVEGEHRVATRKSPVLVQPEELREAIREKKKVRVVDVRKTEEYRKGHIPTSVSLPLGDVLNAESLEKVVEVFENAGIDDDIHVVVYDDTFGALAARVAWTLEYIGHQYVSLLSVTYGTWKSMGLKTERKKAAYKKARHSLKVNNNILATADYVNNSAGSDGKVLVDSRERLNYLDHHIPKAMNIPWKSFSAEDAILKSASDIRRMLQNRRISENQEVITYCGSVGTLSGLAYYGLQLAGYTNVKLYAKSLREWKSLGLPTEVVSDASYWDLSAE
jgi:thiosulfate/3-mercaptopyruvate sulfurtransferase